MRVHDALHAHRSGLAIGVGIGAGVAAGFAGLCVFFLFFVLLTRPPDGIRGQAWRLLALTSLAAAGVGGVIGSLVGLVRGLAYPRTAYFAFMEGGVLASVPMLFLGVVVGTVVAYDHVRNSTRSS